MDQRREFALKALGTLNFRALCQEYGISAKTGYKWRERFLRQGLEGMEEESRRPRSSPKQLSEEQVCEMVKLKLVHRHWGPRKIRTRAGLARLEPVVGVVGGLGDRFGTRSPGPSPR